MKSGSAIVKMNTLEGESGWFTGIQGERSVWTGAIYQAFKNSEVVGRCEEVIVGTIDSNG